MDLLPSTAELFYPLHTIGLALLVWLAWLLLDAEPAPGQPATANRRTLTGVALMGFLLSTVRPYEPAVLLAVYALYIGGTWRDELRAARLRIGGVLLCAVAPGLLYSAWLATQPVWSGFSAKALHLVHPRVFWLLGFGGLWLLAARGAWTLWRERGRGRFAALWFGFVAVLLLVWNTPQTKLASGAGVALALTGGPALAGLLADMQRRFSRPLVLGAGTLLVLLLAGPGSLLLAVREAALAPPRVEPAIWRLAEKLRERPRATTPVVLCEYAVGEVLPGLAGVRVYAGHWALTDDCEAKQAALRAAGLEPDSPAPATLAPDSRLQTLLTATKADYLLVHRSRPAATIAARIPHLQFVAGYGDWLLYRPTIGRS